MIPSYELNNSYDILFQDHFKHYTPETKKLAENILESWESLPETDKNDYLNTKQVNRLKKFLEEEYNEEIAQEHKRNNEKAIQEQSRIYNLLINPNLWNIINKEFDKKIEGEEDARRVIFFVANMRNIVNRNKATDNLMINDTGGTGKDHVVSAIFSILPESEKVKRERISPKVLAYLNDIKACPEGWFKKTLYLEDVPNEVLNDDAFKVMCSSDPNGITQTSIVVNNQLKDINIRGKPSIIITIASANPKQELLRRFPIQNLTSTIKQTEAILKKQAIFAEQGISESYDETIKKSLSELKQIKVKVPFAQKIVSAFPSGNVIIRTHFPRFLDYIKSVCALYQYQRQKDKEGYYIAEEQDYEIARQMITSTTSNQLMIPLTRTLKQIVDKFSEIEQREYARTEIEDLMQTIAQGGWLHSQLNKLVEFGILVKRTERIEGSNKPITLYSFNNVHRLELPDFKDLDKISENKETSENKENTEKTEYKIIKPSKHKISDLTKDNKKVLYSENSVFSYEVPEPDDMITKEEYLEDKDE